MRVKTHPKWDGKSLLLEVEGPDPDGDVMISVRHDAFYIDQRDVPGLIKALQATLRKKVKP